MQHGLIAGEPLGHILIDEYVAALEDGDEEVIDSTEEKLLAIMEEIEEAIDGNE